MKNADGFSRHHWFVASFFVVFSFVTLFSMCITHVAPAGNFSQYDPAVFNLIYYIPITLWVGLFGLCGLFLYLFSGPKRLSPLFVNALLFLIALIILVVFFGLPYGVESNPRFVDSWLHGKVAKEILVGGALVPTREVIYLTYPSSFTFLSILSIVSGLGLEALLRFLPVAFVMMFFTFMVVMFKRITGDLRLSVTAVLIFALSTFYLAFHFSPEIFGWLFFFLLLAFLAKGIKQFKAGGFVSKTDTLVIMFLIVAIALTHPVTQFTLLLVLLALLVLGALSRRDKYVSSNLVLFAAVVFISWSLYFGYIYFDIIVEGFRAAFERIISNLSSSMAARVFVETSPEEVAGLLLYRRILYLLTPFAAIFGGILYFRRNKPSFIFSLSFIIVGGLMVPLTVFGILPLERSIKLAFIPLSLFAAVYVVYKKKVGVLFLAFLLFTIPLNFAAVYWGEHPGRRRLFQSPVKSGRVLSFPQV